MFFSEDLLPLCETGFLVLINSEAAQSFCGRHLEVTSVPGFCLSGALSLFPGGHLSYRANGVVSTSLKCFSEEFLGRIQGRKRVYEMF